MTSGFYLFDYFSTLSVNGLIRILEIKNADEMRPILERIPISTRTLPSIIMFAAASKVVLVLIFNSFLVYIFTSASWQVCTKNQGIVEVQREDETDQTHRRRSSARIAAPVNVTVTSVEEPQREVQPAFNPYMGRKNKETHF